MELFRDAYGNARTIDLFYLLQCFQIFFPLFFLGPCDTEAQPSLHQPGRSLPSLLELEAR